MAETKATPNEINLGAQTAAVATNQTTASSTFTDLTTTGPAVTVTIGKNGLALVTVSADVSNNTLNCYGVMGFDVSGANTVAAADTKSLYLKVGVANQTARGSYTALLTGLTAGSTTFTAKYRQSNGGTAAFTYREISVIPL